MEPLLWLAQFGVLSTPQLVRLIGRYEKGVQRSMRAVFDAGLVEVIPIPRAALAPPGTPEDHRLLFGSAPNVYRLSKTGVKYLAGEGIAEPITPPTIGVKNTLFAAHELQVRDFLVWLVESCRLYRLEVLRTSVDRPVLGEAMPDALFIVKLTQGRLVGLVECDRGTERGVSRWQNKARSYAQMFASGALQEATGGLRNARILVTTPSITRRNQLAGLIRELSPELASQYWLTTVDTLERPGFTEPVWIRATGGEALALVPPDRVEARTP